MGFEDQLISAGKTLKNTQTIGGYAIPFFYAIIIVIGCCCCVGLRCFSYHYYNKKETEEDNTDIDEETRTERAAGPDQVALELRQNNAPLGSESGSSPDRAGRPVTSGAAAWTKLRDKLGRDFYFNQDTGESRWTDPYTARSSHLPGNWQEMYDSASRRAYYYNAKTGVSQWIRPEG